MKYTTYNVQQLANRKGKPWNDNTDARCVKFGIVIAPLVVSIFVDFTGIELGFLLV